MEHAVFQQSLTAKEITELFDRQMKAGETGPEHGYEFDALRLVLKGVESKDAPG